MATKHGGRRPGAGRPKGSKNRTTKYGQGENRKQCTVCDETRSEVIRTRTHNLPSGAKWVNRRRKCLACGEIFGTVEEIPATRQPDLFGENNE